MCNKFWTEYKVLLLVLPAGPSGGGSKFPWEMGIGTEAWTVAAVVEGIRVWGGMVRVDCLVRWSAGVDAATGPLDRGGGGGAPVDGGPGGGGLGGINPVALLGPSATGARADLKILVGGGSSSSLFDESEEKMRAGLSEVEGL